MDRRQFLTGSVAGGFGTVALGADGKGGGDGGLLRTPASVMAPRADGVEVVWAVNRLCRGWVECRETGGEARRFAADDFGFVPQGEAILRVRLSGLKPGTAHELRVVVESADVAKTREETPWKPFRTLDPTGDSAHFAVWNDTHECHDTIRKLDELTPAADFLLWNGDTCNDWHQEEWLVPTLLHPAGCDITRGRPLLLSWGNHDVRGKWAFRVSDMIAMPHGRPFCAFRHGPVAFVCLHTGEDKPDDHPSFGARVAFEPLRHEQAAWLRDVTARPEIRDAPHKVVFCHIPLRWTLELAETDYRKGGYDLVARASREAWHDALAAWGAQVIISGHTHQDAWIPADARFPYGQLVSGGPKMDAARWIEGKADGSGLTLVMRDLAGATVREVKLPRA